MKARTPRQLSLENTSHGGVRQGAGRKRKAGAGMPHERRPLLGGRHPVHVTLHVADDVIGLRSRRSFEIVCAALAAQAERPGFRVTGVSVQGNHLHLMIEPADARVLAIGMKSLVPRLARGINRLAGRTGPVFHDRFYAHVLRTPTEVRNVQRYVFGNRASHAARRGRPLAPGYRDPYTLGYFGDRIVLPAAGPTVVQPPETWLLATGWKRARSVTLPSGARGLLAVPSRDSGSATRNHGPGTGAVG